MDVEKLVKIIQHFECKVRLKHIEDERPEAWATGIIIPVPGYIELHGPWPIREVEWLEIDPIVMEHIGRLVAPRRINNLALLEAELREGNIAYTISEEIIRVPLYA